MKTKLQIASYEAVNQNYLRLHIQSNGQTCGSVDFINEKINFNVTGNCFFKGMDAITNIELEYAEDILILKLRKGKNLTFICSPEMFTTIKNHINRIIE